MFNTDEIIKLCEEINMPKEAAEQIAAFACNFTESELKALEKHADKLLDIKTGEKASEKIIELCGNHGLKSLSVYLSIALKTRIMYKEKGIDEKIFIDTMKIFSRFVNEHFEIFGCYGFDRGWWIYRNLSLSLFRLGLLEFEMKILNEDIGKYKEGTKALSVHIPSDAVITRESLDSSYKAAVEFFGKYFPDFKYEFFRCHTWLFAPILDEILPIDSRIRLFKNDYEIVSVDLDGPDENEYLQWAFKKNPKDFKTAADFKTLPENTSLQRGLKKHVLNGGNVGSGYGILKI